jgi:isopentenyl phosphate kinase
MESATVVKLGGSIITDKSKECTPNLESIYSAADDLASYHRPLILLHGGGSYAHPIVRRARLQVGVTARFQLRYISETELHLDELTRIIGVSLLKRGKPFVPIRPMSFITLNGGRIGRYFVEPIVRALNLGLVPLIHGDLAFDVQRGCGIVSADRIASMLGEKLKVSRVLFGCDVDGVYTENPKTSKHATLIEVVSRKNYLKVLSMLEKTHSLDATGSMLGKVKEAIRLARHGRTSYIFNMSRKHALRDALNGVMSRGTTFSPWQTCS